MNDENRSESTAASARVRVPRAVTFDVTNTLLHVEPGVGEVYAEYAARHGCALEPGITTIQFVTAMKKHQSARRAERPGELVYGGTREEAIVFWRGVVRDTLLGAGGDPARDWAADESRFEAFFAEVFDGLTDPRHWRVEAGAMETLAALRDRGIATAIVSNWDARLPKLLRALELDAAVDAVVVSYEVGVEKPAATIFHAALARLGGIAPDDAWHVGDHPREDVAGAREAGLQPLLFASEAATMKLAESSAADLIAGVPSISHLSSIVDMINDADRAAGAHP